MVAAAAAAAVAYATPIALAAAKSAAADAKITLDKKLLGPCKWAIGVWHAAYKAQAETLLDEAAMHADAATKYALASAVIQIRQNPTWARRFAGQEKVEAWGPNPTCKWGTSVNTYGPPEARARAIMQANMHAATAGDAALEAGTAAADIPVWVWIAGGVAAAFFLTRRGN
jgi:hypothetical protein